jgi:hypothetical protein
LKEAGMSEKKPLDISPGEKGKSGFEDLDFYWTLAFLIGQ